MRRQPILLQTSLQITKVSYLLEFWFIPRISIFLITKYNNEFQEFQYSVISLLIDSGAGLVLSMVRFSPIIQQQK